MGLLDMFKKKKNEESNQGVPSAPQAVTGVENIGVGQMQVPQQPAVPIPQMPVEQSAQAAISVDPAVAPQVNQTDFSAPVQPMAPVMPEVAPVAPSENVVQIQDPMAQVPEQNFGSMPQDNPFMEPVVPVVEEQVATTPQPTVDIFTQPPQNIEPTNEITQTVVDTGATIDTPQPVMDQQAALNVDASQIVSGNVDDESKADAITQIVSQEVNASENQAVEAPPVAEQPQEIINLTNGPLETNVEPVMPVVEPVETSDNVIPSVDNSELSTTEEPVQEITDLPTTPVVEPVTPQVEVAPTLNVETPQVQPIVNEDVNNQVTMEPVVEQPQQEVVEQPAVETQEIVEPQVEETSVEVPHSVEVENIQPIMAMDDSEESEEEVIPTSVQAPQPTIEPQINLEQVAVPEPVENTEPVVEDVQSNEVAEEPVVEIESTNEVSAETPLVSETPVVEQPAEEVSPQEEVKTVEVEQEEVQETQQEPVVEEVAPEVNENASVVQDTTEEVEESKEQPTVEEKVVENVENTEVSTNTEEVTTDEEVKPTPLEPAQEASVPQNLPNIEDEPKVEPTNVVETKAPQASSLFCDRCGQMLDGTSSVCPNCGKPVN